MERILTDKERNIIRGKILAGHATMKEIFSIFSHIDAMEEWLDEVEVDDLFGTEGWRHCVGLD